METQTNTKKKNAQRTVVSEPIAAPVEDGAQFGPAMQSLLSLVNLVRGMSPEGGKALNPKLILSTTGLEIRFSGAGGAGEESAAPEMTNPEQYSRMERSLKQLSARVARIEEAPGLSQEWFFKIEQSLKELRQATAKVEATLAHSVAGLEAELASHADAVQTLSASVRQNEEMMESLVESWSSMDQLDVNDLGPELVLGRDKLAS